jgi:flagellar assembly protein FliH
MSDSTAERWQPRTLTSVPVDAKSLEEVADQARQKGYADGLAQGQVEARKQGEATANELAALWHSMQKPMAHQDKDVSEHLLALVVSISTSVLRRELSIDEGAIKAALDDALGHLAECDAPITITLSPADKALVETLLDEERLTAQLVSDNTMLRGGCLLRRGDALVDATIEGRIRQLIEQLAGAEVQPTEEQVESAPMDADRISAIAKRFSSDDSNG